MDSKLDKKAKAAEDDMMAKLEENAKINAKKFVELEFAQAWMQGTLKWQSESIGTIESDIQRNSDMIESKLCAKAAEVASNCGCGRCQQYQHQVYRMAKEICVVQHAALEVCFLVMETITLASCILFFIHEHDR